MAEQMVTVDGKEIKAADMPKNCFMVQGKWYTEKGLPANLSAYKYLWAKKTVAQKAESKKKSKAPSTQTQSSPVQDAPTAK
jgi:hypothetical protein